MDAIRALLRVDAVDPNIPNVDGVTPLIAAIGNELVPPELRVGMALLLIDHPRVNVNRRGPDNKLPLQIVLEARLGVEVFSAIYRRNLMDYDAAVRAIAEDLAKQLSPSIHGEALSAIQQLQRDPRVNVDYTERSPDQLINAILRKIDFLRNRLGIDRSDWPGKIVERLEAIETNTRLYDNFLTKHDWGSLRLLLTLL
jgi:hypothetical protein